MKNLNSLLLIFGYFTTRNYEGFMQQLKVGFLGTGRITQVHAYSLLALKFCYNEVPGIGLSSVTYSRKAADYLKLFREKTAQ